MAASSGNWHAYAYAAFGANYKNFVTGELVPPHPKQGRMRRPPSRRISRLVRQRIVETDGYDGACGKFCVFWVRGTQDCASSQKMFLVGFTNEVSSSVPE